jgi:hypothetical protein
MKTQFLSVASTSYPIRRTYEPEIKPLSISALPFVYRPRRGFKDASNWHMPPTDDYGQACRFGRECAAHFIQYLKNNPDSVESNLLGHVASAINFKDETGAKGYWVGFFSHLERLIEFGARHVDVFADVDKIHALYDKIEADRELEAEETEKGAF